MSETDKYHQIVESVIQRQTLTVEEAARALGIGRSAGYAAARSGELPTIKLGRRIVVPVAALERLLAGEVTAA